MASEYFEHHLLLQGVFKNGSLFRLFRSFQASLTR